MRKATTSDIHAKLELATGSVLGSTSRQLFHLVRVARNTLIHSGGRADQTLLNRIAHTDTAALADWSGITGSRFPAYRLGEPVRMEIPELIGALAVCKRLAEESNVAIQSAVGRTRWANIAVADWHVDALPGNPEQQWRRFKGFARQYYSAIGLHEVELRAAMAGG